MRGNLRWSLVVLVLALAACADETSPPQQVVSGPRPTAAPITPTQEQAYRDQLKAMFGKRDETPRPDVKVLTLDGATNVALVKVGEDGEASVKCVEDVDDGIGFLKDTVRAPGTAEVK